MKRNIKNYSYIKLWKAAQKGNQEDINKLGDWCNAYGHNYWNGEYYDIEGERLFPVYKNPGKNQYEIIGYEFGKKNNKK